MHIAYQQHLLASQSMLVSPVAYKLHLLTPDIMAVSVLQITNGLPLQHRNCRVTQHAAGGGRDQNQDTLN